ncbi:MAG: nucleotide exchange factor GrpE [Lachnospiraceae bacterium]|jgi:molecular chaperone GrpE|nr:nucleotide exchange factor GrpE [Lachnospiraceae bacterium]MBQ8139211.1 nucleotide exchange factor GrpE [Lachnospiraceae bacterium]
MAEEEIKKEAAAQEAAEDTKKAEAEETKAEETKAEEAKTEEPSKKSKKEKPSKTDKEKEALKEQVSVLEDKVKRQLAEFENFRNRTEKEKTASYDNGAANALKKFLPVVDNFERGLASVPEDKKDDPFVQGMDKIYRQFVTELENIGVEPIEALGLPLDPNLHNAVTQQESDEYEPGTICAELQKGYTYHGIVLRYSMVAVVPE